MAKSVFAFVFGFSWRYSATLHAIEMPSNVEVPRPISSSTMSDFGVALLRMFAASCISTRNVERPRERSSPAPMRVNTLWSAPRRIDAAGTKLPACAITAIVATWRMYVDLPAMLGPVMSMIWSVVQLSAVPFGTKGSASGSCSMIGWRPSAISSTSESSTAGRE